MSTYDELARKVNQTEVMQRFLADLDKESVKLLFTICKEYESCREPVPDHRIHAPGYLGGVTLRALLAAGLLERETGRRLAIYQYKPTPEGVEYYRKLVQEGWTPSHLATGDIASPHA